MSKTYSFWGKKMIIDTYGKSFLEECLLTNKESHVILCDICGKSFSERNDLSNHKCTHTREYTENPYRCDICGKSFSEKSNLTKHKHTLTGEKPYHCDICGKSFSQRGLFTNHRYIHTVQKTTSL
ncbi:---NA--- [Octopus vulgaris]|uniref:---NA n=1 Tax=Octopus vulgaris TaxID=6645 RepID=A0AA36AJ47_OCTVU|nr:---NA--- [Octopus vulgaris]